MAVDLYHPNSRVVLGWSPKAGCTVVLKMFLNDCGLLEEALRYSNWVHDYRDAFLSPCPVEATGIVARIKFVRNPYARAVSSYLSICLGRYRQFPMFDHFDHLSFEIFLQYLASGGLTSDFHLDKQYREGEHYDEIVRIEDMDAVMPLLNQKYGLALNWNFSSGHHITKQPNLTTEYQGAKDFSKVFYEIGSYKQFYNETNRRLVQNIYADDILNYGYTYDDFLAADV